MFVSEFVANISYFTLMRNDNHPNVFRARNRSGDVASKEQKRSEGQYTMDVRI